MRSSELENVIHEHLVEVYESAAVSFSVMSAQTAVVHHVNVTDCSCPSAFALEQNCSLLETISSVVEGTTSVTVTVLSISGCSGPFQLEREAGIHRVLSVISAMLDLM